MGVLLLFSCNKPSKDNIEVVDFDGLYSKIDLSVDKTYVINFWATWCPPCVAELAALDQAADKLFGEIEILLMAAPTKISI